MKTLMKLVVVVLLSVAAGRGIQGILEDHREAAQMSALWADFLEVPKDFRESSTAVAAGLVAGWDRSPSDEQQELLINEVAPRVAYIMSNNGRFGNRVWRHYLPAVEHKLAANASW